MEKYEVIRMIKVGRAILEVTLLTTPYYLLFVSCPGRQYCYSINGQFMEESHYESLESKSCVVVVPNFQQRLLVKKKDELHFSILKLPELREERQIALKEDDNQIEQFEVRSCDPNIEITFVTAGRLIRMSQQIVTKNQTRNKGVSR